MRSHAMPPSAWLRLLGAAALLIVPAEAGMALTLSEVADEIGATNFYAAGYTGSNVILGNVEGGFSWTNHQVLDQGQIPQELRFPGVADLGPQAHPTMVAGVMVAQGVLNDGTASPAGPGIASGASLWSAQIATSISGNSFSISGNSLLYPLMVFGQTGLNAQGVAGGAGARTVNVINSSWGGNDDTGNTVINVIYDYLADARGVTMVVSAGNSGQGPGTVGYPANSWNVIAVGASDGTLSNDQVTSFSSGGPTGSFGLNGTRTKPDLVAPGLNIVMPVTGASNAFTTASGTSFSAPIVAASAGLITDMGQQTGRSTDPRVIKAVLMNSATELAGWSQVTTNIAASNILGRTTINTTPLDSSQGAGRLNLGTAYSQYQASTGNGSAAGAVHATGWDLAVVSNGTPKDYSFDTALAGGSHLAATLTWFMHRSVTGFDANAADPFSATSFSNDRFEDLNLSLFRANDGTGVAEGDPLAASISGWYSPTNSATGWDSVEHLSLALPDTGRYVLRVDLAGTMFDFTGQSGNETYALAWMASPVPEPGVGFMLMAGGGLLVLLRAVRKPRPSGDSATFRAGLNFVRSSASRLSRKSRGGPR